MYLEKKYQFAMDEGKLLGHIVSKEGIIIDANRVVLIDGIPIPKTMKSIQ